MGNNFVNQSSCAAPIAFILWTPLVSKGRVISVCFQDKPFNITVVQVYAPTTDVKEAEVEQFCEDLQDLLELTHTHTQDALSSQVSGIQKWEVKRYLE